MTRTMRRTMALLALLGIFAIGVVVGHHFSGGATLAFSEPSPDGSERLDYYHVNRWQSIWRGQADMPGYVGLVRVAGGETLGTSGVFEMSGALPTIWQRDAVQVGTSATFDRRTGRWTMLE